MSGAALHTHMIRHNSLRVHCPCVNCDGGATASPPDGRFVGLALGSLLRLTPRGLWGIEALPHHRLLAGLVGNLLNSLPASSPAAFHLQPDFHTSSQIAGVKIS